MKLLKYSIGAIMVSLILQLCNACVNVKVARFTRNDKQMQRFYSKKEVKFEIKYFTKGKNTIRALRVGDTSLPYFLMLHCSPGSNTDFDSYISDTQFLNKYCMILCDRPGYGYSDFGKADTSILHQSKIILECLSPWLEGKKFSVLGYSFGGPVAATIASLVPKQISKLVLMSAAIAPGEEKVFDLSYTIIKPKWKWLFPKAAYLPSAEKLAHKNALETIKPLIQTYPGEVLMIHGMADNLVYFSNTEFAKRNFINSKKLTIVGLPGQSHAILWTKADLIKKYVLNFLERKL